MQGSKKNIGVIGATSLVGQSLLAQLNSEGCEVKAFTRGDADQERHPGVEWHKLDAIEHGPLSCSAEVAITQWICVAPIWCLSDYFPLLNIYGAQRIVALSSTSIFTKKDSIDHEEKMKARMLADGEKALVTWAEQNGIEWLIVRPTLIYGSGKDKNISEIARFIGRFGFFPLAGKAEGFRQPVHAEDVASVCRSALMSADLANRSYNISGGERITYREMVKRIFIAMGRPVLMPYVPLWLFRAVIFFLRLMPRYSHWTPSMAIRMNQDLEFDSSDAIKDLSYNPRSFILADGDIPIKS